jgi:hypothetical protein
MEPGNDVLCEFVSPGGEFRLRFDDDGKVAYAYLIKGDTIVGDVWLYNRCSAPDQSEWENPENLPFANLPEFTSVDGHFELAVQMGDILVNWQYTGKQARAFVFLNGALVASVGEGEKPGYCRFALKDGPCAKVLREPDGNLAGSGDAIPTH